MRTASVAAIVVAGSLASAPFARAAPPDFPDLDSQTAVDPADYYVKGSHPSNSGWVFSTNAGLRCQDSLIAEIGVFCQTGDRSFISASVSSAGQVSATGTTLTDGAYPLLDAGMRLTTDNGVTCAVLNDETLACRTVTPASWGPNVANPPGKVYGEHGFVLAPSGDASTF